MFRKNVSMIFQQPSKPIIASLFLALCSMLLPACSMNSSPSTNTDSVSNEQASILVFPKITTMRAGESQQFEAWLVDTTNPDLGPSAPGRGVGRGWVFPGSNTTRPRVTWSVTVGNVSVNGLFTAPNAVGTTSAVLTASSTTDHHLKASLPIQIIGLAQAPGSPDSPGSPGSSGSPGSPSSSGSPGSPAPPSQPGTSSEQLPVPQLPQIYIDTTFNLPQGATWKAHTSTDFTNALNAANPGDTIVLDAGTTYSGNFTLPVKSNANHQWIYIISSALNSLPAPGTRVNPTTDAANMPKIATPNVSPAITIPPGASNYRFVGLEMTSVSTQGCHPSVNCFSYQLIYMAGKPAQGLPDSITVDRCYLHGSPTQDVREGIIANGSNIAVVDSYISDIHESTIDSQAIVAYFSPGPIKIVNNFLSATTENVLFGGAGGASNPWVPSDIEIRNNWFYKPPEWAAVGVTIPPNNQWKEKNLLEFKNARRVLVDGNTLENTWVSGQTGFAVLFTVRTGQSGNLAVVDDITFTNNLLKNVTSGFSTLYQDDSCGKPPYQQCTNLGETKRILVYNNLILFRDPHLPGTPANWGLQLDPGMTDFVFQNNTTVPAAGTDCYQSIYFNMYQGMKWPPAEPLTTNVWLLDNALCRQPTGAWGGQGTAGLTNYMGDPAPLDPRFVGNAMFVPSSDKVETFPPGNISTKDAFTYVDPAAGNYQLVTPNAGTTTSGVSSVTLERALRAAQQN
jgi:hypothetical protein